MQPAANPLFHSSPRFAETDFPALFAKAAPPGQGNSVRGAGIQLWLCTAPRSPRDSS